MADISSKLTSKGLIDKVKSEPVLHVFKIILVFFYSTEIENLINLSVLFKIDKVRLKLCFRNLKSFISINQLEESLIIKINLLLVRTI